MNEDKTEHLKIAYVETTNISISSKDCPFRANICYESLGKYKKECPYCKQFWLDTRTVECGFAGETEETKRILYQMAAKGPIMW